MSGVALVALVLVGLAPLDPGSPPGEPHRLAYTFTSPTEVGLLDLASLERTGEVVEGWSLNLFKEPYKPDYAPVAAAVHWSRVRIDCGSRMARFTHGIGMVDGAVAFSVPIEMEEMPVAAGWELDAGYVCDEVAPARPVETSLADAVASAQAIMTSDAWAAEPR